MKRTLFLSVIVLLILGILCGCEKQNDHSEQDFSNIPEDYYIENSDYILSGNITDGYYITFFPEYHPNSGTDDMQTADLEFDSMQDFATTVMEGSLSDYQKAKIYTVFPRDEKGTITCDFGNLQEVKLPTGMHRKNVSWTGVIYTQSFSSDKNSFGNVTVYPQDKYEEKYQKDYENRLKASSISIVNEEKISDRDATLIYYYTQLAEMKCLRYVLVDGNKTYVVEEEYFLSAVYVDENLISDSIPYRINMYCTDGTNYYVIDLYHLDSRPTEEWLLSFGLTKFSYATPQPNVGRVTGDSSQ